MDWDFILAIIFGVIIGMMIPIDKKRKKNGYKIMGYENLKTHMNKFHDLLCVTDKIIKTKFISNPNKKNLSIEELIDINDSIAELESILPKVKNELSSQMTFAIIKSKEIEKLTEEIVDKKAVKEIISNTSMCVDDMFSQIPEKVMKKTIIDHPMTDKEFGAARQSLY